LSPVFCTQLLFLLLELGNPDLQGPPGHPAADSAALLSTHLKVPSTVMSLKPILQQQQQQQQQQQPSIGSLFASGPAATTQAMFASLDREI
jgi:hypothetical protein